jgi:K+-sensing histidine kinase KdpD
MEVNVYELVTEVVTSLEKAIKDKNISFFYSGDRSLTLNSNKIILQFILKKIIDNAVKYSYIDREIEVEMVFNSPFIHLFIKDKGIGIDSQKLSTIFTLDGSVFTGTQNEKGAGLSLVIVKDFVKMLGGEIEIYPNNDNIGTIIELRFRTL